MQIKVEPPFRGHSQDQEKCSQNGAVSSYRGDCKVQASIQGTPSESGEVAMNVVYAQVPKSALYVGWVCC